MVDVTKLLLVNQGKCWERLRQASDELMAYTPLPTPYRWLLLLVCRVAERELAGLLPLLDEEERAAVLGVGLEGE